jgi:hypothetical protein
LVIALLVGIGSSQRFANCIDNQGQDPASQNPEHKAAAIPVSHPSRIDIYAVCTMRFANNNGNAITALATVLLALVTGLLVWIVWLQFSTSRAQLRAYVFIETAGIFDGPTWATADVPAGSGCPGSHLVIKNFGQTPAYDVRHWSAIMVCAPGQENDICTVPDDITNSHPTTFGPGGATNMTRRFTRAINNFEIASLFTGGLSIVAFGKITYRDAFKVDHETNYRLAYVGHYPPPQGSILAFANEGNSAN